MIDIHTHILPDIDDGAESYKEAAAIVKESHRQGIRKMVATPHYIENDYQFSRSDLTSRIEKLQTELQAGDINVDIMPGAEVAISYDLGHKIDENKIISLNNSRYILLEFPFFEFPEYAEEVIYDMKVMNYFPIIAHPERYVYVRSNIDKLYHLITKGHVYAQLNIGSLLGKFGVRVKRTAVKLIKNNLIHFIASDVHSNSHRRQYFKKGIKILNGMDEKYLNSYLENAENVINDKPLQIMPPTSVSAATFFGKMKNIFVSA